MLELMIHMLKLIVPELRRIECVHDDWNDDDDNEYEYHFEYELDDLRLEQRRHYEAIIKYIEKKRIYMIDICEVAIHPHRNKVDWWGPSCKSEIKDSSEEPYMYWLPYP